MKNKQIFSESTPPRHKGLFARFFALFFCLVMGMNVWGTSYIPGTFKNVTTNETVMYDVFAAANATTASKWLVNPRGGATASKSYTNVTSDTKGNPNGITDNIESSSNVNMPTIQVPSTASYNQSGKYVMHMRLKGITGMIVHGVTGSSGRGIQIYAQEYSSSLTETTTYGTAKASQTRSGNSGSFLVAYNGFDASKEYLVTLAAVSGDVQLYAMELIVPSTSYTLSFNANGGTGTVADITGSGSKTLPAANAFTAPANKEFKEWNTKNDGSGTSYAAGATYTLSANATLYAIWQDETVKSAIVYANTKGASTAALPTQYTEGVGIAEFAALEDVTGFHFTGWNPSSISSSATGEQTITAEWEVVVAPYFVMNYTKPGDSKVESIVCTNGSIANDNEGQAFTFETNDLKFGSNNNRLLVTLDNATIVEGTKIEISWISLYNDGSKTGIGVLSENNANKTMDITGLGGTSKTETGTESYTFTAADAANYVDQFIITRNGTGKSLGLTGIKVYNVGPAITKYSVTYAKGEGEVTGSVPTQESLAAGKTFTVAGKGDLAREGYDFAGWNDGSADYAAGATYTMGTADVVLTAQWQAAATKHTVIYMDGAEEISREDVTEGEKAASVPAPTKELNTFAGWEDAEHNAIDFATLTINAAVTAYAKWTLYDFATSIDIEAYAKSDPNTNVKGQLDAANIAYSGVDNGNIDKTTNNNGAYAGIKLKSASAYLTFRADANKRVTVKLGYMAAGAHMTINGVNDTKYSNNLTGGSTSSGDNFVDYYWDTNTETIFKLSMTTGSTCVVKAITIADIPAQSNDASLATLTLNGETIEGFTSTKEKYAITLPYGTTENPVVVATATDVNATVSTPIQVSGTLAGNDLQYDWHVTAEDASVKYYRINFTVAPKLGAEIIKATITSNNAATASGLYAGSVATLNSSKKLGNNGDYVKFVLKTDETFATGDVLAFDVTAANGANKIYITSDAPAKANSATATVLSTLDHTFATGMNYITLPEAINGLSEFYLYRVDSKFNPTINSAAVLRQMPSMIKSFTIGEAEGVIDQENKTIAVTVPYGTDVTALTPEVEAYANGGATVTPTTAQDFTSAKTYTVTSAYGEDAAVSYVVTVTVAEPACPTAVTIAGTATYKDGDAIELTATTDGTGSVTYQWYKDGVLIEGAIIATFSKTATMTDGGEYVCKVNQGTCGEVASEAYAVTVNKIGVSKVELSATEVDVKVGETTVVTATITPANASYPEITEWQMPENNEIPYFSVNGGNPTTLTALVPTSGKNIYAIADGKKSSGYSIKAYYEVLFSGCDAIEPMKFYGSGITLPTPTGGTEPFIGWYSDAEFTQFVGAAGKTGYKPADNVTLYAKWTLPDAETPNITTQPQGATYDEGDPIAPLTVVATVTEGTLSYQWYKGSEEVGENSASYTPTEEGSYKVVVTNTLAGHNPASETSDVAVVTINRTYVQTDVTGSVTWDWSKSSVATLNETYTDQLLAELIPETATFATSNLVISTNGKAYAVRDTKYAQVSKIKFHTTVPGFITVKFSDTGSSSRSDSEEYYRYLYVNGVKTQYYSFGTSAGAHGLFTTDEIFVAEGDVELSFKKQDAATNCNVYIITFTEVSMTTIRSTTPGKIVTMCQSKAIKAMDGAVAYEVLSKNAIGIDLQEAELPLVAGKPYILEASKTEIRVVYTGEDATEVAPANGLIGNLSNADGNIDITDYSAETPNYVVQNNHLCRANSNYLLPDRAYLDYSAIGVVAPAPGRRRISLGGAEAEVATGMEAIESVEAQKILRDGAIIIVRGGKMYNVNGQLLK